MENSTRISRRRALAGLTAIGATVVSRPSFAAPALDASDFGLIPDNPREDQSAILQRAIDEAEATERTLFIPPGVYSVSDIRFPKRGVIEGIPGSTALAASARGRIGYIDNPYGPITLMGLVFTTLSGDDEPQEEGGLLEVQGGGYVSILRCEFRHAPANALTLTETSAIVDQCTIIGTYLAGIFSIDSSASVITNNFVSDCANNGILVWGSENGRNGTIVSGNHIYQIGATRGGNGQNGNGINVFRTDEVIIADNHIAECAFSAIRLNSTNDTQVTGNTCMDSGEVAIFSEFAFSGSIIANNIVDRAAAGISMTNFNEGGHLAVCTGNIVRNIFPKSEVNPDTVPYGIFAEADTVVSNNVVDTVPGLGIGAGYGPYLRDVHVSDNVIRDVDIGIGVSVAEGAGAAQVVDNHIAGARLHAMAGMAWQDVMSDDLARDAAQFPHVVVNGNSVG